MFSHPKLGSDLLIGSDQESGCDKGVACEKSVCQRAPKKKRSIEAKIIMKKNQSEEEIK